MQPTHVYTLCSKNFLNHVPTLNHATLSPASSHLKADVPVLPHGGMGRAGRRLEVQRFYFIYAMIYIYVFFQWPSEWVSSQRMILAV